jgi:hypothetical protein
MSDKPRTRPDRGPSMLQIENLCKSYAPKRAQKWGRLR